MEKIREVVVVFAVAVLVACFLGVVLLGTFLLSVDALAYWQGGELRDAMIPALFVLALWGVVAAGVISLLEARR